MFKVINTTWIQEQLEIEANIKTRQKELGLDLCPIKLSLDMNCMTEDEKKSYNEDEDIISEADVLIWNMQPMTDKFKEKVKQAQRRRLKRLGIKIEI